MTEKVLNEIINEVGLLKEHYDSFGYDFKNGKGLFVQVVNNGNGNEYFLEANEICEDSGWEPYSEWLGFIPFGDIEKFKTEVKKFVVENNLCDILEEN